MPSAKLNPDQRQTLLKVARRSILQGLETHQPLALRAMDYPQALQPVRASFVTLEKAGRLRGCIGTLTAYLPLVEDVAQRAFGAAFQDPRFLPVSVKELPQLAIHISVLSPAEPLPCRDEAQLLSLLRPGVDGLVLSHGRLRATFLPAVWEQLSDPRLFMAHLKQKAGMPPDFWAADMLVERYTTESFGEGDS